MQIIKPSYEIWMLPPGDEILKFIEKCGRVCYKSEDSITTDSAIAFVKMLLKKGHLTPIEHVSMTVKFVFDRGVSHEMVRHRLCAFSQESTRYCNYGKGKFGSEITVIDPLFWEKGSEEYSVWKEQMQSAEKAYLDLLYKSSPQEARNVLPNSLKTEIVVTANLREWRHIFTLRCSPAAHPQMREAMCPLLMEVRWKVPVIFDDINY
jgi:thymidylate synthase (FAD)